MSTAHAMGVGELLQGWIDPGTAGALQVRGLALDSRRVADGDIFVALAGGLHAHGLAFARDAVAAGAVLVLAEPAPGVEAPQGLAAPVLWLDGLRGHLGALAARFHGDPSRDLHVVGVTGTNGKTSTVQFLAQALEHVGLRSATIGTLGAGLHGALAPGEYTTPDAIGVQRLLAGFRGAGASHVAMEVSSHALAQGRVNAVRFELAAFTNLTRDHLDYHGSMERYGEAKRRLFGWPGLRGAAINLDDAFGRRLAGALDGVECVGYGIASDDATVRASALEATPSGLSFDLVTPHGSGRVATGLFGRFNVSNLLAVATCLGQFGIGFEAIRSALAAMRPVPGRMACIGGGDRPLVVVDYAHTPDALQQVLGTLRAHCVGALTCVFGCGGERDAGKRPQMGAIAEALADRIIVTDDNPRGEDGDAIVADIMAGLRRPDEAVVERDRAGAISLALARAGAGDVVLVAGKGHESSQEVDGMKYPFEDLAVARRVLEIGR